MRFTLMNTAARITNVNSRAESHGQEKKPAADLKLFVHLPNKELRQFDKTLRELFYTETTKGQVDAIDLTQIRYPKIRFPIMWEDEVVGATVTVHQGIGPDSDIKIEGAIVGKFQIEPLEGGSVGVGFSCQFRPKDEHQIGRLCMLNGQEVPVTVESPTEKEQQKQRDLLDTDPEEKDKGKDPA